VGIQSLKNSGVRTFQKFSGMLVGNEPFGVQKATGGTVVVYDGYYYHSFTSSGTFTPLQNITCDILIVAGGGSGGFGNGGGGGGAGGLLAFTSVYYFT
jgi:hypothetical protein